MAYLRLKSATDKDFTYLSFPQLSAWQSKKVEEKWKNFLRKWKKSGRIFNQTHLKMATAKPKLSSYVQKDGTRQIYIAVTHKKNKKPFDTGFSVFEHQWDDQLKQVVDHPEKKKINGVIKKMMGEFDTYSLQCQVNGRRFSLSELFKTEDQIQSSEIKSLSEWMKQEAEGYLDRGSRAMHDEFVKIASIIDEWKPGSIFSDFQADGALTKLEKYMREKRGNGANTRQNRFSVMRQSYERAMYKGHAPFPNPFKGYRIKGEKKKKEKLTFEELELLQNYKTTRSNRKLARDMWLLSYFTRGIRFENVIYIKKSDVVNNRIEFQMVKSKKPGYQEAHPALKKILDRWMDTPGEFLFPVVKKEMDRNSKEFLDLKKHKGTNINNSIGQIMKELGIKKEITFHCARHTFAYHMLLNGAPVKAIQQALGHSKIETTERYLDDLENRTVDDYTNKMYAGKLRVA